MSGFDAVGSFRTVWGESVFWDDQRQRLFFADCLSGTIHWLEGGAGDLCTYVPPSNPTGLVPTTDGRLVAVLDDGLYVVDVDAGSAELLSPFPEGIGGRGNDAVADLDGNLITGTLNLGPTDADGNPVVGSAWRYSTTGEWTLLDPDIANTNGPNHLVIEGVSTLIVGDSNADYFAYDYNVTTGAVGRRRVFGAMTDLAGVPDGSTVDDDSGLWCALCGGGQVVRFTASGLDRTLPVPALNPTDLTFGGPDLDRLYVTTISGDGGQGSLDGHLLVADGIARGRPEPRFRLS